MQLSTKEFESGGSTGFFSFRGWYRAGGEVQKVIHETFVLDHY